MKGGQFARLVANIKADGCLTSLPLVNLQDGKLAVASGSHRVSAGIKAGLDESDVIEITTPLTRQQFVALQLSHNAIVGQDDLSVLRSLYDELGFSFKEYSGLTDDAFDLASLDTSVLRVEQPFYEELQVSFLPADIKVFTEWLDTIGKSKTAGQHLVGRYEDFDHFFEQLITLKRVKNIRNTAVALRVMAELAGAAIADLVAAEAAALAVAEGTPDARA